jgi:hypothetical protein
LVQLLVLHSFSRNDDLQLEESVWLLSSMIETQQSCNRKVSSSPTSFNTELQWTTLFCLIHFEVTTAKCECIKHIFVTCLWHHIFLLLLHLGWVPSRILQACHPSLMCSILFQQCIKLNCSKILVYVQSFTLRNRTPRSRMC